jgi:hypothetical protein
MDGPHFCTLPRPRVHGEGGAGTVILGRFGGPRVTWTGDGGGPTRVGTGSTGVLWPG